MILNLLKLFFPTDIVNITFSYYFEKIKINNNIINYYDLNNYLFKKKIIDHNFWKIKYFVNNIISTIEYYENSYLKKTVIYKDINLIKKNFIYDKNNILINHNINIYDYYSNKYKIKYYINNKLYMIKYFSTIDLNYKKINNIYRIDYYNSLGYITKQKNF